MQKIRVLIVDDCSIARDGIRSILKAFPDMEVVGEAANGLEAIAQAEPLQPTVVLMDVQMPEMDGIEAIGPIKQRTPKIKILVLTVHSSYQGRALAAGADGCLMKDCTRQELVQEIRRLGGIGENYHYEATHRLSPSYTRSGHHPRARCVEGSQVKTHLMPNLVIS